MCMKLVNLYFYVYKVYNSINFIQKCMKLLNDVAYTNNYIIYKM